MIELTAPETASRPLLSMGSIDPVLPSDFVPVQGAKLHLAMGQDSPGLDQATTAVEIGQTDEYRRLISERDRIQNQQRKNDIAQSLLQSGTLDPTGLQVIQGLSQEELVSPDLSDIVEKKYSQIYTTTSAASLDNDILDEATEVDPASVHDILDVTEFASYKNSVLQTSLAQMVKEDEDRSFVSKAWDFGERLVPFREWYVKQNAVGGDLISGILPGSNMEEQFAYLWGLPAEQFKTEFASALEDMKGRNLSIAISWVQGVMSYGASSANMDNLFGVLDLTSVLPAKTLARAGRALVKGSLKSPLKIPEVATEIGRYDVASEGRVLQDIEQGNFFNQNIRRVDELEATIPSVTSPNKLMTGGINLPQEAINRLKLALTERSGKAQEFILDPLQIDRLTPDEYRAAVEDVRTTFERNYPSVTKNVIGVESLPSDAGNVYRAKVIIGRRDGTLFESEKAAKNFAARYLAPGGDRAGPLRTTDYAVEQVGSGFQLTVVKNLDESRYLSDLKIETGQKTPQTFLGWLRSPDYTLSTQQVKARSTVTHSAEKMAQIVDEMTKPIGALPKAEFDELQDLLEINRAQRSFYETYQDFQQAFFDRFKKNPTEGQFDSYGAYVQINDLDLVTRDLDWYKQKARLGLEQIKLKGSDDTLEFEGKFLNELPEYDDFRFSKLEAGKFSKPKSSRYIDQAERTKIHKLLSEGWRLVLSADDTKIISKGKEGYANVFLVREAEHSRVGVKNVDKKAGGHLVHEYDYYVKQPKLSGEGANKYYHGDTTLFGARTQAEADEVAGLFEQARKKLARGDKDAIKFIRDNLPVSPKEFMAAVRRGDFDLNTEFVGTRKGSRTIDTKNIPGVIDTQKSPLNLSGRIRGRYAGERGETNIDIIKSEGNGVFKTEAAPYLSPIDTLRISTKDMINVRAFNDYATLTAQNFVREFGDILDFSPAELRIAPISIVMEPRFLGNANPERVASAKNVSRAYNNLMNYGTLLDRRLTAFKEDFIRSISKRLGEKGANWVEDRMLTKVRNPGVFMRSVAFHSKLGMFNVKQFFTQAQQMVNVAAIAGQNGLRGGLASIPGRAALVTSNPEVLKGIAKAVERTGVMSASEFEESLTLFKRSGFSSIGKDVAYLDDLKGPEIRNGQIAGVAKKFLDWGTTPFAEGERIVRLAAWNAAYLEKRAVKKGKLDRRDVADILQRSKDLAGNMTRDSNAAWQKGYLSVFTQFFGFQARLMEQFIGKKLTGWEKARLFTAFSAVYGTPVALGSVSGVIPVREMVIQQLSDAGIQYDETLMEPFIDGFASSMTEFITGSDLNIAGRGPGGIPTFYDLIRSDKDFADVFLGASGAIAIDTFQSSIPMWRNMASEWMDYKDGIYNLKQDDIVNVARNISTVNDLHNLWTAYAIGIWSSRNGSDITKMDLPEALMATIVGVQPDRIEDAFVKSKSNKAFNEWQTKGINEISNDVRKYMRMDPGPMREKLIREAKARMELYLLTLSQKNRVWRQALEKEMMDDRVLERYNEVQQTRERLGQ